MYDHITSFIDDIERIGFGKAGSLAEPLTHAMYQPEIVDKRYRDTLASHGLEARPWCADVESLDLKRLRRIALRAGFSCISMSCNAI